MTKKMQEPANSNAPLRSLDDVDLDEAKGGGAHTGENLSISSTGNEERTAKHKPREIVVVGSKIKEPLR